MPILRHMSVWLFGDEGDMLTNSATQALIVAGSVLVTGATLLSPLVTDLATVFSVSEPRAGWLIIGFTAAAAISLPIVGALADHIGRKTVLVIGLVVFGISGSGVGLVTWFEAAVILRILQGVGFACSLPIILTLFGDLYDGAQETTVQGMRVTVSSVVNMIVPLLAGSLFVYSWRYPFALYLIALPAAIWIWLAVPPIESSNDWPFRKYIRQTTVFLTEIPIASLMLSFMARFIVYYGFLTYISVLAVQELGLSVVVVGALLSLFSLVKTLCSTQAGRLSLWFDPAFLATAGFVIITCGIILMGAVPTSAALLVGMALVGVGDGVLAPSQKSVVNRLASPDYRAGANSAALAFQNVGKVIGPLGVGALLNTIGPASAFVLLGGIGGGLGVVTLVGVALWQDP